MASQILAGSAFAQAYRRPESYAGLQTASAPPGTHQLKQRVSTRCTRDTTAHLRQSGRLHPRSSQLRERLGASARARTLELQALLHLGRIAVVAVVPRWPRLSVFCPENGQVERYVSRKHQYICAPLTTPGLPCRTAMIPPPVSREQVQHTASTLATT